MGQRGPDSLDQTAQKVHWLAAHSKSIVIIAAWLRAGPVAGRPGGAAAHLDGLRLIQTQVDPVIVSALET